MTDDAFDALLDFLRTTRGLDLTVYKRTTLRRRLERRLQAVKVDDVASYIDYLQVHPEEMSLLFDMVLINVTSFFRDASAWAYLAEEVIPEILSVRGPSAPIRVWSAGCATGEEAYSLAILLAEAMGPDDFAARVKIYATDADEDALATARLGAYTERQLEGVEPDLRERYFERTNGALTFRKDLRRAVIFGRHDLTTDAPISRLDLLVCRNTLMYFNAEAQARILERFDFGLLPTGFLFLGKAETLLSHTADFRPQDLRHRVFRKALGRRPRLESLTRPGERPDPPEGGGDLFESAVLSVPLAQLIIDPAGVLRGASDLATKLFRLAPADIGRALQDLEISYRPVELRSLIDRAHAERRVVEATDVAWSRPGSAEGMSLRVVVTPLAPVSDADAGGAAVAFFDETRHRRLEDELAASNRQLETAYEELQSTNEELETTNEELQSTIEELETTNEELQSTNEELETMNEELQSTNEEMHAVNEEFTERTSELNEANAYLGAILGSLRTGVVVLDRDLHVKVWNAWSEELWGLRSDEVLGKNFLNLDIGLPVDALREPVRSAMVSTDGDAHSRLDAVNRRGRPIRVDVTIGQLIVGQAPPGVMLLVEELDGDRDGDGAGPPS